MVLSAVGRAWVGAAQRSLMSPHNSLAAEAAITLTGPIALEAELRALGPAAHSSIHRHGGG